MSESQSNPDVPQAVAAESLKLSMEVIIDRIRSHRDDLIRDLLKDGKIQSYFSTIHQKNISPVRIEFIRRELKTLSTTPVDLIHYAALIKDIRKNRNFESFGDNQIFYDEVELIFRRYNY
jgi:hypothetical protein